MNPFFIAVIKYLIVQDFSEIFEGDKIIHRSKAVPVEETKIKRIEKLE